MQVFDLPGLIRLSRLSVDNFVDRCILRAGKPCKSRACLNCPEKKQKSKVNQINNLRELACAEPIHKRRKIVAAPQHKICA
jgi:hypothetical protein